ncbi:hypothetical protein HYH03_000025 [Edaphochlamys debaryana]|uniref:Carboxylesterase type B domain-containing protein n=1 Tax=Edaphochlamys debaryana TaxID=47281 RepID=A0A835YHW8_9CHLO|nr:hypothetical protein HYH03_000025 [Edaphochlamys debaryana]|eukprot:KAG2501518.1 hypothetical protein HYH03_000025 [Edaphochlamys debaryana]
MLVQASDAGSRVGRCLQPSRRGSEDCLTLNVWAPATRPTTLLPVRVFLHGGGYQVGTGADPVVNGCALVGDSDIVQVTLNYRLGVLGFLALPELRDEAAGGTTGNWGLLDQRLALQWVRDNIAAFGGDPARVTLTGQSAGAYSTILHSVMPGSVGLFSAIEPLSGSMDAMAVDFLGDAYYKGRRILSALNCSSRGFANASSCLAGVSAADLVSAKVAVQRSTRDDIIPVVDGVAVPKHPSLLMQDASVPAMPALFHVNRREGSLEVSGVVMPLLGPIPDLSTLTFEQIYGALSGAVPDGATALGILRSLVPVPEAFAERFHAQYNNATHGNYLEAAVAAQTDNAYLCTSRRAARAYAKKGAAVRFLISEFMSPTSGCSAYFMGLPGLGIAYFLGAFHTYDLGQAYLAPFVIPGFGECPFTDGEKNASALLAGIGSTFSRTGSPLPPSSRLFQASATDVLRNLTSWPAWTTTSEPILSLDPANLTFANGTALDATCKLWDDMWDYMVARNTTYDAPPDPFVDTSLGRVYGTPCGSSAATAVQYLGIPYAQPPVGALRFKTPRPYTSAYPAPGLNASAYGAACVQRDSSAAGSEDCLTLNVWAPATRPSTLLPVRVFIHGGGYQVGTGSDPVVNGCALVGDSDVVQVTLNYRLGVLGFLALPELRDEAAGGTTGNWGLLDQRLALQWVRDNIAAFGGDPARVTLTGQSAGAYSTILHSVMPGSVGLFSAIEPLSGSMDAMAVDFLGDAYYKGRRILSALNCSSRGFANASSCLAGVSAADLVSAKVAVQRSTRDDIIPVVDGVAVPKHPSLLMQDASVPAMPALFHVNRREGSLEVSGVVMPLLGPIPDLSTLTFEQIYGALSGAVPDGATALGILRSLVPVPEAFAERFHAQYNNATHGNYLEAAVAAQTDNAYLCTSRRAARAYAKKGAAVRFLISEFMSPTSGCSAYFMGLPGLGIAYFLGAFHTYDLGQAYLAPFVIPGFGECPFTDGEKNASALLAGIGSAFSRTGSPLPPSSRLFQAAASAVLRNVSFWPAWTNASSGPIAGPMFQLDPADPSVTDGTEGDTKCKLWDDMWEYMVARNTTYDAPPDPFVDTSRGRVYGTPCGSSATAVQYLGIPYAQPPVGTLRFKAPRPITAKYPFAGLDAKAYGAACIPGDGSATGSEDCLTLNVWAPATRPSTLLPVRVFIHGGGYQVGSGTDPGNSGCPLIADSDVIHVTLNYRLGVLGFLALPELRDEAAGGTTGNWGLLDQRLALQWVRDNIAAFGGDPARVTLTGQSAGAMSTLLHTVMPGSAGLFSSVEALSASMDALAVDFTADAFFKSRRILNALNCSARGYPNASSCLAAVPAAELVAAKVSFFRSVGDDIIPVVDGVAMPRHPSLLMQDASVPAFPALFHVNAREGAYEVTTTVAAFLGGSLPDPTTATVEEVTAVLSAGVPDAAAALGVTRALVPIPESFVKRFLAQYNNATHGSFLEAAIAANTDNVYLCSSRRAARAYVKKGAAVRFLVNQFVEPSSSCSAYFMGLPGLGMAYFLGAFHTYDLYMAHMDPFRPGYEQCPWTLGERNLSAFLAAVVSSGQASGSAVLRNVTSWPAWTTTAEPVLSLDPEAPALLNGTAYDSTCKLWDDMWAFMVARNTTYDPLPPPPSPTPASPSPPSPTSSPPPPPHPPPPAPPITLPSNGVPTVYIAKDSASTVASMAVTQTLEVPLSVGTDPTALAALFPGAVSAAWEATKAALPVEVTGSRNPSVQVQCTDAFLNVFRSELAARANVPLSALASAITCTTLGLTPAAASGRRRLGGRALLQANASATTNFTSAWAGTACARPTSANSTLALTVVLQTGADSTGVSQAAAYTASMTAALAAWGSTGGSSALSGLLVCAPAASRINTTAQVAVTTLVPLNADGLAMYGWACNRSESAIIGGGTCAIVQNGGAAAPSPPPDSGPSDDDSGPDTAVIIGASVAGAVAPLILLAILAVIVMARRRRQQAPPAVAPAPGSNPFQQPPPGYQPPQQQPQAPGPGPPRAQSPGAQQQYAPGYKQMPAAYQPQPSAQQRSPMEAGMPPKATPMEHPASWGHGGGGGVSGNYGYGSGGAPTTVYNNPIARH